MKKVILVLLLFTPPLAFATTADVSLTASVPPTIVAGETATVSVHVVNSGPDTVPGGTVQIGLDTAYALSITGPTGWTCWPGNLGYVGVCTFTSFPPGSADVTISILSNAVKETSVYAALIVALNDPTPNDHNASFQMNVLPAANADVNLKLTHQPAVVRRGATVTMSTLVTNSGPAATGELFLDESIYGIPQTYSIANVSPGWDCQRTVLSTLRCRTSGLAAGASNELRYDIVAPDYTSVSRGSVVHFRGAALTGGLRNSGSESFAVGVDGDFERILLPVVMEPTAGAYGSLWKSTFAAFADSDSPTVLLYPMNDNCYVTCPPPPPYGYALTPRTVLYPNLVKFADNSNPARMLYTGLSTAPLLHMNLRVQDLSRQLQTWGTEIPVVRESEFTTGRIELLNVPLDARFRQTLRFYDPDARGNSQVRVRLFASGTTGGETAVGEQVLTLAVPPYNNGAGALALPIRPGYAQLDGLVQLYPQLAGFSTLRVEVEPVTAGMRQWAFASITNNETQHVTTITPQ